MTVPPGPEVVRWPPDGCYAVVQPVGEPNDWGFYKTERISPIYVNKTDAEKHLDALAEDTSVKAD